MNAIIQAHEDLLQQIRQTEQTALRLAQKGHKISNTIRHLRDSAREIETRIKYFTREEKPSAKPAAQKEPKAPKPSSPSNPAPKSAPAEN